MAIIDYLGLLCSPDADTFSADLRNSFELRRIARRNDVALVVVAALRKSQATKYKERGAVTLDDVSGAGRIVYDAQSVLLVSCEQGE